MKDETERKKEKEEQVERVLELRAHRTRGARAITRGAIHCSCCDALVVVVAHRGARLHVGSCHDAIHGARPVACACHDKKSPRS